MSSNPRVPYRMVHERPRLEGPDGKTLLVHLVVNVEHWQFDRTMPRKILPAPHGAEQVPDIPNFSWAEYGMRVGMSRILDLFAERGLPASTSINAGVVEAYPQCAEAMRDAGWEFIGHGIHQRSVQGEADEEALVAKALEILGRFTGAPVRGWLGPGLRETAATPDILKAKGVDYVCDWVLDDLPAWMTTAHGPLLAMPYNLEVNDSVIYAVEHHSSDEIYRRLADSVACLEKETADGSPRVLPIGLHPHLIGVPHRFGYLEKMLDLLMARGDTAFMTGGAIADWYAAQDPEPSHGA